MAIAIPSQTKKRLIVLVPDGLAGNTDLAHRIYWLATRSGCDVLYVALVDDPEKRLSTMRYMATMKAVTAGNSLVVHSILADTSSWRKTLSELYQPGDRIVCHEEQSVKTGFLKTVPVSEFLQGSLGVPVVKISGFYHPGRLQLGRWAHTLITWLGFLLILAAFTLLEIQLDPVFTGLPGKVLLAVLFTIEIGSIWAWDRIVG